VIASYPPGKTAQKYGKAVWESRYHCLRLELQRVTESGRSQLYRQQEYIAGVVEQVHHCLT